MIDFLLDQHLGGRALDKKYLNFNNLPLKDRCGPDVLNFKVEMSDAVAKTND